MHPSYLRTSSPWTSTARRRCGTPASRVSGWNKWYFAGAVWRPAASKRELKGWVAFLNRTDRLKAKALAGSIQHDAAVIWVEVDVGE